MEVIKALLGYHDCIVHVFMYLCLFGLASIGNGWVGPWDKAINMFSLVPRPHPHERMGLGMRLAHGSTTNHLPTSTTEL